MSEEHITKSTDPIRYDLRRIRTNAGLSLGQVELKSEGRWKRVVVGSYERGDRRPTVEQARGLLAFYGYEMVIRPRIGGA